MTAPRSKLDWYKQSARAAKDLTHAEFRVLMAVASYSGKDGGNAHPGKSRLSADTGIHQKNVQRHLRSLVSHGWLQVEKAGGNMRFKGAATLYKIALPSKGSNSVPKGSNHDSARGVTTTPPSGYTPGHIDHSEDYSSASPSGDGNSKVIQPAIRDWSTFQDLDRLEDWLDLNLDGWRSSSTLENAVFAMWEDHRNPKAILNYACHSMGYRLKLAA